MKYSPRPFERLLTRYIKNQTRIIERLINQFAYDVSMRAIAADISPKEDFYFRNYPALSKQVDTLLKGLSARFVSTIKAGDEWSWDLANAKNDNLLAKLLASIGEARVPAEALARWNQKNLPALKAFEDRRIGGMGLSSKVWSFTKGIKGDLELAFDLGIATGTSADKLSRTIRQFLVEPERLYRRVRDEKGVLRLSKHAANYHPGQGVYRSSYKNAKRLAATETNMAYRTADNERMNQMDFILGYEVHLSNNHTCLDSRGIPQPFHDICDELEGKYPKWFVFKGWHPLCRCYVTTILPDREEFIKYLAAMDKNGHSSYKLQGEVTDVPPQFKEWVRDNTDRIEAAQERGKLPYFLKDNPRAWESILGTSAESAELTVKALSKEDFEMLVNRGILTKSAASLIAQEDTDIAQMLVHSRIASKIGHTMQNARRYIKDAEVSALVTRINALSHKDEMARLAEIDKLRARCGALSAKELQKWGAVNGLVYSGVDANVRFSKGHDYGVINRKRVVTKDLSYDMLVFKSEATGMTYRYPVGIRKAQIPFLAGYADVKIAEKMPQYLRDCVEHINFLPDRNPADKYWEAYYKMPKFQSYATDGSSITFWKHTKDNQDYFTEAILHESSHAFDSKYRITPAKEWREAVVADLARAAKGEERFSFPSWYAYTAYNNANVVDEDFADTLKAFVLYSPVSAFKRLYPNRYKALVEIFVKNKINY